MGNKTDTMQVESDSDKETGAEHNRYDEIDQIGEQAEERKNDAHDYYKSEGEIGQERFFNNFNGINLNNNGAEFLDKLTFLKELGISIVQGAEGNNN
eukprot:6022862-Ditylum_brightwellii.AAC.1